MEISLLPKKNSEGKIFVTIRKIVTKINFVANKKQSDQEFVSDSKVAMETL